MKNVIMLDSHDLDKLSQRGYFVKEEWCLNELDGMSAFQNINDRVRVQVYQGCQGFYELRGRGRGRPKVHVLIEHKWFTPTWYVAENKNGKWINVDFGYSDTVDDAICALRNCVHRLYPATQPTSI